MHRTIAMPGLLVGALAALLLAALPAVGLAQTCSPEDRPLVVLLGSTTRLQLSTRKPIRTVINPKEALLSLRTIERDPTTVLLVGTQPGVTRIDLEDGEGNRESRTVIVQADVEYLSAQIRRAVPLANVDVLPNGTSSVILTGYANRAEDVQLIESIARNAVGAAGGSGTNFQVINGVRLNGVQQVQLDVVVARVARTKARNFGFNFIGNARSTIYGSTVGNVLSGVQSNIVGVPSPVLQPSGFGQVINAIPNNANLFGGVIGNAAGFLGFLEALQVEGLAKLLAQPRLVAQSGQPANFLDGGQQAVPQASGLGVAGVTFAPFGTQLTFLPVVLGNGRIHLEVEPEVSSLDPSSGTSIGGTVVAGRIVQRVHTTVEMEAGQTFVIGGLIQKVQNAEASKVPILGEVPFLGAFFSTKAYNQTETELVILITPHLVDAQSACQVSKVLPGQESRTPDNFELFLEGILEAPRGPRKVFQGCRYVPAYMNGPAAGLYPCAGQGDGLQGRRGLLRGKGAAGGCAVEAVPLTGPEAVPPVTPESAPRGLELPPGQSKALPSSLPRQGNSGPQAAAPAPAGEAPPAQPLTGGVEPASGTSLTIQLPNDNR